MVKASKKLITLIAGVCLVALTGCVGIPTESEVKTGYAIVNSNGNDNLGVVFSPPGPSQGIQPTSLIRNFINAASGQSKNYETAKKYLSAELAGTWNPQQQVLIYTTNPKITALTETEYQVSVSAVARLDATGVYQEINPTETQDFVYTVAQNAEGEWRLTQVPPGLVLAKTFFDQIFSSHALYFYDASFGYLVPDLRWFPNQFTRLTQVVAALLAGPSPGLSGGVLQSAFPTGTALAIDSVTETDGLARVELTSEILALDVKWQRRMVQQLRASVLGVPGVDRLEIVVTNLVLNVAGLGTHPPIKNPQLSSSSPLVLQADTLGLLQGDELVQPINFNNKLGTYSPVELSYSSTSNSAVFRNQDGIYFVSGSADPVQLLADTEYQDPLIDGFGYIWARSSELGGIKLWINNAEFVFQDTSLNQPKITAWAMSRDSTRLIVVSESGGTTQVYLYGVIRDLSGMPVAFGEPKLLYSNSGTGVDVVWAGEGTLVFAWRSGTGVSHLTEIDLGGKSNEFRQPPTITALAGVNRVSQTKILTDSQVLLEIGVNTNWRELATNVQMLAGIID